MKSDKVRELEFTLGNLDKLEMIPQGPGHEHFVDFVARQDLDCNLVYFTREDKPGLRWMIFSNNDHSLSGLRVSSSFFEEICSTVS